MQILMPIQTDLNGRIIEELMDNNNLVCMNDGKGTRINTATGAVPALDITLVSNSLAGVSSWKVLKTTLGSDHYPVACYVGEKAEGRQASGIKKWRFEKANWDEFQRLSEEKILISGRPDDVDELNDQITSIIIAAAEKSIPKSKGRSERKLVPWWTEECRQAVRQRNRALRLLKRTHNMQNPIQYKKAQAVVRRTVRQAKRKSWRNFCSSIGRTTPVGEVWGMIRRMGGDRREWEYPVMMEEGKTAVTDKEKAEIMVKAFAKVHSSENLSDEGNRRRRKTLSQHPEILDRREEVSSSLDEPFTLEEMHRAINKSKPTSPGKDQVSYSMLKHLGEKTLKELLKLYNKVWEKGRLPAVWKEAVVIPIRKPGKDPVKPSSYRPIALTSNICKIMERMITERLTYQLEKTGKIASYQSGFRRGRNTMDPVIRLDRNKKGSSKQRISHCSVF